MQDFTSVYKYHMGRAALSLEEGELGDQHLNLECCGCCKSDTLVPLNEIKTGNVSEGYEECIKLSRGRKSRLGEQQGQRRFGESTAFVSGLEQFDPEDPDAAGHRCHCCAKRSLTAWWE